MSRREYGSGSVYQRASDGRYIGTLEAGWTATGARRRVTVSGKSEAEVRRKLRDKAAALKRGETGTARATVKTWADTWLEMKRGTLRPKAYNAARASVRTWIVPVIGRRRLEELTPADVRAVATAQRSAGRSGATAAATQRTLFNMLRDAIVEGHAVPPRVLLTKAPTVAKSDRQPLTLPETLAALRVASQLPHGVRWVFALLHGMRQGECLGATWDDLDLDAGTYTIRWQLQRFTYLDPKDRSKGFRVPDDLEARHLYRAWHLTPPKSAAGFRVIPLVPGVVEALERWRQVAPANPWGLIWPSAAGTPASHADDLAEWHALQGTAGIGHPSGRYYHVHECRNVTATQLRDLGADALVTQSLLGHSDIATSHRYMRVDDAAKREVLERFAGVLGLG